MDYIQGTFALERQGLTLSQYERQLVKTEEDIWYRNNNCTHAHCPYECEHPQPFIHPDNNMYCGKCWHDNKELVKMIPCSPTICD